MKVMVAVLCMIFLAGCSNIYQSRQSYDRLYERLDRTKAEDYATQKAWDRLKTEEADFISRLNDEQLAAYQNLSDIYATGNPAAEELVRRQLEQSLDADSYAKAVQVMQEKHIIRLRIDAVGRRYRNLQQEGKDLERARQQQRKAVGDYMLRESIRNSGW